MAELDARLQLRRGLRFLNDAGGWQRWFFAALAVGGRCCWPLAEEDARGEWRQALPFALIIGGALGNPPIACGMAT